MAIVQVGDELSVGLGGYLLSNYIVETASEERTGEIEYVKDEGSDTKTGLVSDRGVRISLSALGKADADFAPVKGDIVTVNSVAGVVEEFKVERSRGVAKISLTIYKPDSLTTGS